MSFYSYKKPNGTSNILVYFKCHQESFVWVKNVKSIARFSRVLALLNVIKWLLIDRSSVGKFISLSWLCNFNRHPPMDDPNQRDFMHQYCFITWVCKWILYECLIPSFFMTKQLSSWRLNTQAIGNYLFFSVMLCNRYQANTPYIQHCCQRKFFLEHCFFFPFIQFT